MNTIKLSVMVVAFCAAINLHASNYTLPETYTAGPQSIARNFNHPESGSFSQSSGTTATTAGSTSGGSIPAALMLVGSDILNGPWAAGGGFTHTTSGTGASVAFITVSYDMVTNVDDTGFSSGAIAGYDDCFAKGRSQVNSLSGGWQFQESGHFLSFIGTTFLTNIVCTVTGYQLIATPRGGSDVGAITGGSASIDVAQWGSFHFKPTFIYNNRNGQAGFNGNFLGGALFITRNF